MPNITRELFEEQRRPRCGNANPERMNLEFWEWMIRGEDTLDSSSESLVGKLGLMMRNGVLKSGYGPWRVRDRFDIPLNRDDGPIWTFDRMGRTETELPDGRLICVGGEHEDSYDPDFCIYNDVVVFTPDGTVEIYGYPRGAFPPIDFHTATLVGDLIVLIGGLRYPEDRIPGTCTVFALDTQTYRIEPIETTGDGPGWLFHHEAESNQSGIRVRGGEFEIIKDGKRAHRQNVDEYWLDTVTWTWHRLTDHRAWREYTVTREDRKFWFDDLRSFDEAVFFSAEPVEALGRWHARIRRLEYEGVSVDFKDQFDSIRVLVRGVISQDKLDLLLQALTQRIQHEVGSPCRFTEL